MSLARQFGKEPTHIADIAKDQGISVKYLEQIALSLKKAGIIETVRGRGGGHRLARPPDEISLDEIIAVLEGGRHLVRCLSPSGSCSRASQCAPRLVWQELSQTLFHKLSLWTLGDLLRVEELLMEKERHLPERDKPTFYCPAFPQIAT